MKLNKYIIGIVALAAGFLIAWFAKPTLSNTAGAPKSEQSAESSTPEIWTCSMDPQIRQPEPGDCPICGMDLILLDASSSSDDPLVLEMTAEAVKLAGIQTTVIGETGAVNKTILLNGKIQADERRSSSLSAHIPGRIEQLFITFTGEQVRKGQALATVYSPELVSAQKELLEAQKLADTNPKLVEAARNKLRSWKISSDDISEIEKNGKIKELFTIYAESSGVVTNRRVSVGDYVRAGQAFFDLVDLRKVWVVFDGYEQDLANLKVGQRVSFTAPAIPDKQFETKISYIDPIIDVKSRVAYVRADMDNTSGLLKPEMFVRGKMVTGKESVDKLTVPKTAVLWTGKRSVVYVKQPDTEIPSFGYREVILGQSLGEDYLIEEGLNVGEEVVTNGNFAIDAAAQLNNQQSMMNRLVQVKGSGQKQSEEAVVEETATDDFYVFLNETVNHYLELKDALVETDSVNSVPAAKELSKQFGKFDSQWFENTRQNHWNTQFSNAKSHADLLIGKTGIEEQRVQFEFISNILIAMIKSFGTGQDTLYLQHCPMVDRNRGADWISSEEGIRNPYFGYKMMKCGRVKDSFLPE